MILILQYSMEGVRVLQGFIHLARKYPARAINRASKIALNAGMFRLRPLRGLIKRHSARQELEFADKHPIIRPLSEYQELLTVSFKPIDSERSDCRSRIRRYYLTSTIFISCRELLDKRYH